MRFLPTTIPGRPLLLLLALVAIGAISEAAQASGIRITGPSIYLELEGGALPGMLGDGLEIFTADDLAFMQAELAADGIDTAGRITMFLANTEDGWSFVSLFDRNGTGGIGSNDSFLGFNSVTGIDANRHWNTDQGGNVNWWDLGNQSQLVDGTFEWESGVTSEGFAWGNLSEGMAGTATYVNMGLDQLAPSAMFQFLTWNGTKWDLALGADFADGSDSFALAFKVIPAPGAVALLCIAAVGSRRRRR